MKQYEIINPSDPYTFMAKSKEVAALTVFLLSTMYGAESEDGEEKIPVFIFGGSKEWYQEEFKRTPDEGLDAEKEAVANALLSVMYGNFRDRKRYEAALSAITDERKKKTFIEVWQDGRSSMNDIGSYAHATGERMLHELKNVNP